MVDALSPIPLVLIKSDIDHLSDNTRGVRNGSAFFIPECTKNQPSRLPVNLDFAESLTQFVISYRNLRKKTFEWRVSVFVHDDG